MKLILALLVSCSSQAMFINVLPPELGAYQKYVEAIATDFDRDLKELEAMYEAGGSNKLLSMRSAVFARTFTRRFVQVRQMDVYTQNVINKTVARLVPFMEKVALETYRMKVECPECKK